MVALAGVQPKWIRRAARITLNKLNCARAGGLFRIVQIETQNSCTRSCWFCKFGQPRKDPVDLRLSTPVFERIVSELGKLDFTGRISVYGINEPLLDDRIVDFISGLRRACRRAFLSLDTNGDLLDGTMLDRLSHAGANAVIANAYDRTAMRRLAGLADHGPLILQDFRDAAPRVENRGGNVRLPRPIFDSAQWIDRACLRPSTTLQIRANGDVVLCCGDMYGDVVFGNVAEQSLVNIWNSRDMRLTRRRLRKGERRDLPLCESCSHDGTASFRVPMAARTARMQKLPKRWRESTTASPASGMAKDGRCS